MQPKYPIQEICKYFIVYLWQGRKSTEKNLLCVEKKSACGLIVCHSEHSDVRKRTQSFRAEPAGWAGIQQPAHLTVILCFRGHKGHFKHLGKSWLSKCSPISQFPSRRHRTSSISWNSFPREQHHGSAVVPSRILPISFGGTNLSIEARFKPRVVKK